jgi:hypothetical protein
MTVEYNTAPKHDEKKAHKHCELIKAWADGAEIQYRPINSTDWVDVAAPKWSAGNNYRVKPEPKPDVVKQFFFEPDHDKWYTGNSSKGNNIKAIFDGETGKLKNVEML